MWYDEDMSKKEVRVLISVSLYKKFKIICVEKDLTLPRQIAELMRKFVEIDEMNKKLIETSKKEKAA